MTLERFAYLADAYGADLRRWPAAEQDAAQALLDSGNLHARQTLATAGWLDRQLDSHQPACADPALARRIRQSATVRRSFWSRYADWLSPASFVGAGIAGVFTGMLVASLSMPLPSLPAEILPSVFDQGDAQVVFNVNAQEAEQ
ncbi:hypothetical protein [Pseudomonas fluorescens]|uniref:hypothetical protein n=1 Tax=Pseudomonas fluorescens TaxID=294 RepID=UPI0002DA1C97|nr:hypothetical protein [Pseudomonas fluorescens]